MRPLFLVLFSAACSATPSRPTPTPDAPDSLQAASEAIDASAPVADASDAAPPPPATPQQRVVARAREEVQRQVSYNAAWFKIGYPNGDPDPSVGVCTDVVVRGYRAAGLDFQQLVHEDVVRSPAAYDPYVKSIDYNIDHRRVGPLMVYLNRHAQKLDTKDNATYEPGDIVVISFNPCPGCSPQHIGVVSDKMGPRGVRLMIHNLGPTPNEDDTLDAWTRLGHYRVLK